MKRSIFILLFLCSFALTGCGKKHEVKTNEQIKEEFIEQGYKFDDGYFSKGDYSFISFSSGSKIFVAYREENGRIDFDNYDCPAVNFDDSEDNVCGYNDENDAKKELDKVMDSVDVTYDELKAFLDWMAAESNN